MPFQRRNGHSMNIPTLFRRDPNSQLVFDEPTYQCRWVLERHTVVVATRQWDGLWCWVRYGQFWASYTLADTEVPPPGWTPFHGCASPRRGFLQVTDAIPELIWHRKAWRAYRGIPLDGTYELIGPQIKNNAERQQDHLLIPHGLHVFSDVERTPAGIRAFLQGAPVEGIVFYSADGRLAKIKRRDYGFPWPLS